jgi:predicted pyridoxine 5'-phosphate oxidase superfamily flavin-nucleotide-binding protein
MPVSNYITEEMMPAFQGVVPAVLASCSAQGVPNVTYISQVYYVDREHVALSRQFFNKTVRNITENPVVCIILTCPGTYNMYKMLLEFKQSMTEGEIFTSMRLQLEVIAGIQGKSDTFNLKAADIYKIRTIEYVYARGHE